MRNIVIADTSCLILFHKIGELDILRQVYDTVSITPEIAEEFSEDMIAFSIKTLRQL